MSYIRYGALSVPVDANNRPLKDAEGKLRPAVLRQGAHGSCFGAIGNCSAAAGHQLNGRFYLSSNWSYAAMRKYIELFRSTYDLGFQFDRIDRETGVKSTITLPRPTISLYTLDSNARGSNRQFGRDSGAAQCKCYVGLTFDKRYDINEIFVALKMFGKTSCSPVYHRNGDTESEKFLKAVEAGIPFRAIQLIMGFLGGAAGYQFPMSASTYSWFSKAKLRDFISNAVFTAKGYGYYRGSHQAPILPDGKRLNVSAPVFNWYFCGENNVPLDQRTNYGFFNSDGSFSVVNMKRIWSAMERILYPERANNGR